MIYHFRAISDESENFIFDIAIDSNNTFLEFHDFIQEMLDYDPSQMASFFITDHDWNKEQEITLIDMDNEGQNTPSMENTKLSAFISTEKQRLLYAFDLFAERMLFIELLQIDKGRLEKTICLKKEGIPPEQINEKSFNFDLTNETLLSEDNDIDDLLSDEEDPDNYSDEEFDENDFY
jgi:hypothetical protein